MDVTTVARVRPSSLQVAAALHPGPQGTSDQQPLYTASAAALAGGDRASELTSSLLPGLKRAELLKEANLQDRARCEQSEVISRWHAPDSLLYFSRGSGSGGIEVLGKIDTGDVSWALLSPRVFSSILSTRGWSAVGGLSMLNTSIPGMFSRARFGTSIRAGDLGRGADPMEGGVGTIWLHILRVFSAEWRVLSTTYRTLLGNV